MTLRYLFIDMNSYFASVEQHDQPALRGQPVAVTPTLVATGCCIAASYEAKRHGVKTGTSVREARLLCPGICVVAARPQRYVAIHHQIVEAVRSCIPVENVMSIDEMACTLRGEQRQPEQAAQLAQQIKAALRQQVGETMRCSIGSAPNVMLAKMAADMRKPDGLTLLPQADIPGRLLSLSLEDFPGIGHNMHTRLQRAGVTTVQHMYQLPPAELSRIWGSKLLGTTWWHRIRGADIPDKPTVRRTVGHSHVLPPEFRSDEAAHAVAIRLLHKAAARLRFLNCWTRRLSVSVQERDHGRWHADQRIAPSQDTLTLIQTLEPLWQRKPRGAPFLVAVTLSDLTPDHETPPPLFEEDRKLVALAQTMDQLNQRFGKHAVFFGGMVSARTTAPTRIGFTSVPDLRVRDA